MKMSADAKIFQVDHWWEGFSDAKLDTRYKEYYLSDLLYLLEDDMKTKLRWVFSHDSSGGLLRGYVS
jgi:hypothetical protein